MSNLFSNLKNGTFGQNKPFQPYLGRKETMKRANNISPFQPVPPPTPAITPAAPLNRTNPVITPTQFKIPATGGVMGGQTIPTNPTITPANPITPTIAPANPAPVAPTITPVNSNQMLRQPIINQRNTNFAVRPSGGIGTGSTLQSQNPGLSRPTNPFMNRRFNPTLARTTY